MPRLFAGGGVPWTLIFMLPGFQVLWSPSVCSCDQRRPVERGRRPIVPFLHRLLSILITISFVACPARGEQLVELLNQTLRKYDLPAMGALCLRGDIVQEWAVAGVRKRGHLDPVLPQDLWHLGSCTKAMTATLGARLVERERMQWNMTIGEVFPEIRGKVHPEYVDVTFEQLLTNRGGIPAEMRNTEAWKRAWKQKGSLIEQRHRFMIDVLRMPPPVPAGDYLYSNQGFAIAGHMCEQVTGVAWEKLMVEEVFEPLGMSSAGFGAPGARDPHQPVGHKKDGKPADPKADNPPAISPAGRVHCSLHDWARFVAIHLLGAQGHSKYLSGRTFLRLHRPAPGKGNRYAMGWNVTHREWGGTVASHAGSNTMWYCVTWVSPEKNLAVLVTCNQAGDAAVKACDETAWALIQRELARRESSTSSNTPLGATQRRSSGVGRSGDQGWTRVTAESLELCQSSR